MMVAYIAYQELTPHTKARANALVRKNPNYKTWLKWIPPGVSKAESNEMLFMIAATWPDQIKGDASYKNDGDHGGNRPEGSPDPSGNHGYSDKLRHKYWHFVDTPFSVDGTTLPPTPTPNAGERIALFRSVLASTKGDALKSYDLVWLLHLVGDVHQPLHCATRVSAAAPAGDDGGNGVALSCPECAPKLHTFWDDLPGMALTIPDGIQPAIEAAKALQKADPANAAKSDEKEWIAESFQAAQDTVYQPPIGAGSGPFSVTQAYNDAATKLALDRVALAGARLGKLLNGELK